MKNAPHQFQDKVSKVVSITNECPSSNYLLNQSLSPSHGPSAMASLQASNNPRIERWAIPLPIVHVFNPSPKYPPIQALDTNSLLDTGTKRVPKVYINPNDGSTELILWRTDYNF
jgi:hypothetical protein